MDSHAATFAIQVDVERNVARGEFAGDLTREAMQLAATEVETQIGRLRPGFSLFADFGKVTSMELDCVPPLTHIMDLCHAAGIGRVVRILPAPDRDIGITLLGIVHYRGRVRAMTVETQAEAERALE